MQYKSIQNLQTLQGYIFHILQHFATKLCNFTYFSMLFLAVVIYLHQGEAIYFEARCREVRTLRSFCTSPERSCTSPWELVSMMEQSENVMVA